MKRRYVAQQQRAARKDINTPAKIELLQKHKEVKHVGKSFLKSRKLLALTLLLVVGTPAAAIAVNWYKAAEFFGVINSGLTNVSVAHINLGELNASSYFSASGNATIQVIEETGVNITGLLLYAHTKPKTDNGSYFTERFLELNLNLTIDGQEFNEIPIVVDSEFAEDQWTYEEYTWWWKRRGYYYRYTPWNETTLQKGSYNATFTIYGYTALPSHQLPVNIKFYLELNPA